MHQSKLLLFLSIALLIALIITAAVSKPGEYEELLLISRKQGYETAARMEDVKELNETCMLTYEISQERSVQAGNIRKSVILKGTNYTFPFVTRASILSGGFFTKEAEDYDGKVAVMNKSAAFGIFGGIDIVGNELLIDKTKYKVVGTVNDGDEDNMNVYIPGSVMNKSPGAYMAKLDGEAGITGAYVENEFKQIGVEPASYDFVYLDTAVRIIREKAVAAVMMFLCALLLVLLVNLVRRWRVISGGKRIRTTSLISMGVAIGVVFGVFMWLSASCIEMLIKWGRYEPLSGVFADGFQSKLQFLYNIESCTNTLFICYIVILALFAITSLRQH